LEINVAKKDQDMDIKKSPPPIGGKRTPRDLEEGERTQKMFSRNKLFDLNLSNDLDIPGFAERGEHTPDIDPGYVFPKDETRIVLWGMMNGDRILATGHTGTGKTSLFEQIGARLNFNVFKINFDGHVSRADLVGEWLIKAGETYFKYGILPTAMRTPGSIVIIDEWDTVNDDSSFVLQRVLQKEDGKLVIYENGGEIVQLQKGYVVCAIANTVGQGDDTGLYTHGTRHQNYAQLNRFGLCIRCDYLPPEKEQAMLMKRFADQDLKQHEAEAFIKTINKVRDGFTNGAVSVPLSTRDVINWVEKYLFIGNPMMSATYCFLNRMTLEDAEACKGIIQRAFEEA